MHILGLILTVSVAAVLFAGCGFGSRQIEELAGYGPLRVGERIPGSTGVTTTGEKFTAGDPWTNLTIYCVADTEPPFSVEVGNTMSSIRARQLGARVVRSSDGKMAHQFGIKLVAQEPWRFDTSLVVLCDTNSRILRIWKPATTDDLDELLTRFATQQWRSASGVSPTVPH
jgi:hypothetical protein